MKTPELDQEQRDDLETLSATRRWTGFLNRYFRVFAVVMLSILGLVGAAALVKFDAHVETIIAPHYVKTERYEREKEAAIADMKIAKLQSDQQVLEVRQQGQRTEIAIQKLEATSETRYDRIMDAIQKMRDGK